MTAVTFPRRRHVTTPPEVRDAVEARVASLEARLGSLRAAETVLDVHDEHVDPAEVVSRLRNLEARLALEDLDR